MRTIPKLLTSSVLLFAPLWLTAQTVYIPSGTSGIANSTNANVGIGIDTPLEKLHINGSIRGASTGGALRISTLYGYTEIGPMNASWAHFQTNLSKFYFNKGVHVNGPISSYDALNLELQTNGSTRMTVLNSNGYVGIGNTNPQGYLQVNPQRPVIIKYNGGSGVHGSEIGFNTILDTYVTPNKLRKLGGTLQRGGASLAVDYSGNMLFQMYAGVDENESIVDHKPQVTFTNAGNIGIGVASPTYKVDISNEAGQAENLLRVRVSDAGDTDYFKIFNSTGTATQFIPHLYSVHKSSTNPALVVTGEIGSEAGTQPVTVFDARLNGGLVTQTSTRPLFVWNNYTTRMMTLTASGNVGIGTASPDAKLAVKGHIHAQEVRLDMTGAVAPDYVFETDYKLATLQEVETFIKENKHLPEIPSAQQMEENGLHLKEMNLLLLKKVEELTLHLIAKEKQDQQRDEEIKGLKLEIENLKKKK